MPDYNVANRAVVSAWDLPNGPPGPPLDRPMAGIVMSVNAVEIFMGQTANIALDASKTGIFTKHLTFCSAFAILWKPLPDGFFTRVSMVHLPGGPDPMAVNWAEMQAHMEPYGTFYGVLANSQATVLSDSFVEAVLLNTLIPPGNMWVYNAQHPGGAINFGLNWVGEAGEC